MERERPWHPKPAVAAAAAQASAGAGVRVVGAGGERTPIRDLGFQVVWGRTSEGQGWCR